MLHPAKSLDEFLAMCCTEIERRAQLLETAPGVLHEGASALRAVLPAAQTATSNRPPTTVPAVASLATMTRSALSDAAILAVDEVPWIPTPRFAEDHGETVALGIISEVRDLGDLVCGLMLVAPGAAYPEHAHPPQEIYLPIAGDGRWRYGGSTEYRTLDADTLIYNKPRELHGAIATNDPLLALYILWP